MRLSEITGTDPLDDVEIDWHLSGSSAWIDNFTVPSGKRRQGLGRAAYERWEAALPPQVKAVRLYAADTGSGRSNDFWDALGFEYDVTGDDLSLEDDAAWYMHKGVNGHPTAPPKEYDPDD
jgi:hypothetical protein